MEPKSLGTRKLRPREAIAHIIPVVSYSGVVDVGLGRIASLFIVVVAVLDSDCGPAITSLYLAASIRRPVVVAVVDRIVITAAVVAATAV